MHVACVDSNRSGPRVSFLELNKDPVMAWTIGCLP